MSSGSSTRSQPRDLIGQAETCDRSDRTVLDMDSSESPVHGQQEGSAYNGHFASVCYHPLFLFTDHGDCVAAQAAGPLPSAPTPFQHTAGIGDVHK